jgi:hypothetical protein
MHVLLIIVLAHAVILGFAFFFAGWLSLAIPDQEDLSQIKNAYDEARPKGWIHGLIVGAQVRREYSNPFRAAQNWSKRPQARRLIYAGIAFLAVAAASAYQLGVFP